MNKPRIGLTVANLKRAEKYRRSLERAGADVEVLVPDSASPDLLNRLDGILLAGGGDIDASEFKEINHPNVHSINRQRDKMELNLTRDALQRGIPVFGICRGVQLMNVALGGNLIQDIPDEIKTMITHDDSDSSRQNLVHKIAIREGTRLHSILGKNRIAVNSFHHQAVKDLGKGLVVAARSDDDIVEAIELPDASYFLGVQWHPEEFVDHDALFHSLFQAFVDACK